VLALTLRVASAEVEEVLDAVLPVLPGGIHLRADGEQTSMTVHATPGAPGEDELRRLAGSRLIELSTTEASDDWRERRLERYEPLVVAERFLLRPDWAPPSQDPSLIEIVLGQSAAFGTGLHPTTQACLATLATAEPGGSFADYGCGSGVLSIAAAHLGWSPVVAVDVDETSVDVARRNAEANGVEIDARRLDLTSDPPPPAETIAANIPPGVQTALARRIDRAPALLIASGFHPDEIPEVTAAWGAHGLQVSDEVRANEWSVLVMT
jgi:ribosomal protein L11 methyltransferase